MAMPMPMPRFPNGPFLKMLLLKMWKKINAHVKFSVSITKCENIWIKREFFPSKINKKVNMKKVVFSFQNINSPVGTGRKLNVHKTSDA